MSNPKPDDDLTPLRLYFRPLPHAVPAACRFRHLLKRALRDLHLKCVRVEDAGADKSVAQPGEQDAAVPQEVNRHEKRTAP